VVTTPLPPLVDVLVDANCSAVAMSTLPTTSELAASSPTTIAVEDPVLDEQRVRILTEVSSRECA
jgi:hypothetical protein